MNFPTKIYPSIRLPKNIDRSIYTSYYDTEAHIAANHSYYGIDLTNTVHETTHGINGILSSVNKSQCLYCLDDIYIHLPKVTRATITDAHKFIPQNLRFDGFSKYLDEQRFPPRNIAKIPGITYVGHDDNPLYILDEWSAYINGSICAIELIKNNVFDKVIPKEYRNKTLTVKRSIEMAFYSVAVIKAILSRENYDRDLLIENWQFQYCRTQYILDDIKNLQNDSRIYSKEQDKVLAAFINSELAEYIPTELLK